MKIKHTWVKLVAMMVLLGAATKVQAAGTAYTFNVTSGVWNNSANWTPTGIPGGNAADTATIPTAKTVTGMGGTAVSIATFTIQGTGVLNIDSSSTLNVSGVFTLGNSASVAYLTNNGTLNLTGSGNDFICDASVLTNTAGSIFTCSCGNTGNANDASPTFGNNGTATFTGTTAPFSTGNKKFLIINGPNGVLNLNNGPSAASFGNSAQATFTAVGNTVNYGYAGAQSPVGGGASISAYYNLTLSGSGAKTTGSATVNGTLSLQGTATMSSAVTYGAGGTLVYNGSSAQTATANEFPSTANSSNLTINNSAGVNIPTSFARTINGTLTLASGTFTLNSVLTLGNGANIIRTAGSLSTAPTFGTSVNVTYNNTSSTTTGSELPTSTTVLNNLTINNLAGVVLNANAKVNGTFAVTYNGSTVPLAAGANTLTFASSPVNITVSGSTLAATTYTIVSSSGTTVSGTLGTVTVLGSGAPYSPTPTASDSSGQLILTIPSSGPTPTITGAATTTAFTTTYGTPSANQSFAVSGANLTANLVATAGTGFQVATSSGGPYGSSVSFTPSSGSASGTVYVELSPTAAVSGNYNSVNAVVLSSTSAINQNITTPSSGNSVAVATPTVTVTVGSYTYTGSAQGPNAVTISTTDTGTVTWSYVGVSGTTYGPSAARPTNAGSYTATATVAADGNNNSASSSATAFSIAMATPTVTVNVGSYAYNGSPQGPNTVTISTTDTGAVTWSYVGVSGTTYGPSATLPTVLGNYTATATVAADSNNNSASSSATAFAIITAPATAYTFNVTSGVWNNSANWTPNTGYPGLNSADTATIPTGDTVIGLGGTTVSITNLTIGGTGSLTIDSSSTLNVSGTFTMGNSSSGACALTNNGTVNLTGTGNIFVMAAGSSSGVLLTNTAGSTFTCAGGCQSGNANAVWTFGNNGTATFTGSTSPFSTGFHNAAVNNGSNGILNLDNSVAAFGNSGTLTATAVGSTVNYGYAGAQSVATQTGTATYYNLTLSGSGSKTGSATISANGTLSLQGTATVGNTITYGSGATLAYASSAQQTSSANELPSGGVPNLTINNGSGVLLGGNSSVSSTLTLTAGILNLNGHTLSAGSVTRTSGSILLTPTVMLNNKVYDGTTAATTIATRSLAGTLTGDSGNVSLGTSGTVSAFSSANVGSYTQSVTGLSLSGTSSANYSLSTTSVSPSASITKATPTVVVANYNVTYDGSAHSASVTSITGVNGEAGGTVGMVTLPASQTVAGIYSDSWSFTGTANYNNIGATPITDTIGKATPTVTVTVGSYTYNGSSQGPNSYTTNPSGDTGTPTWSYVGTGSTTYGPGATPPTAAGTYTAQVSLGADTNNNASSSSATAFSIAKATPALTISILSSENPSGYRDSIYFTATNLPEDATGNVLFETNSVLFDTETLDDGGATSLSITNLPRGTNLIVAAYAGDNNYYGSTNSLWQVVTNHPPVAAPMTVTRTPGLNALIALSDLATNWSDVDGDTVELTSLDLLTTNGVNLTLLNTTTNSDGSYVITNTAYIGYTNSLNVNDQFTYTIADGYGGTNTGIVNIVVSPFVTGAQISAPTISGGTASLTFYGIPGFTYITQRATNLVSAVWVNISTNTAVTNGVFGVTDDFNDLGGPPTSAYYRLSWTP
jgi:hypothetical protein